jgi:hypothetical protein
MKIIPKFYHGILDYMSGLLLLAGPNLFGFDEIGGAPAWIPPIVGMMILLQALMTDYELGAMKVVPIATHLMMDYVIGAFLVVAPFVFGISNRSRAATVLLLTMGVVAFAAAAMTEPRGRLREIL